MNSQFGIRTILNDHPIVPVVNILEAEQVKGIVERLHQKSINCIEITLRSEQAMEAIELALRVRPKGFKVGVGTITSASQVNECTKLGVDFLVSPGVSGSIAKAFGDSKTPFLPGVMTPSEIIMAIGRGWDTLKLFPFNIAGGVKALNNYEKVFPQIQFCPTGGINQQNYNDILALDNVVSVGGSWVLKA